MQKEYNFQEGEVLLIDKPYEWTSFDVVKKLKFGLKVKKIGHAGTLDPLATGLLVLCTGKKTKEIEKYQAQEKEYTGSFVIGQTRPSADLETEVDSETSISHITEDDLQNAARKLTGVIAQVPPIHSAVKVDGVRVYKHARAGREVKLEPRQVEIKVFELTEISLPEIHFRVVCSKGTYIRSLARDFGEILGVGGYLASLRRTRIGDFSVQEALSPTEFIQKIKAEEE